MNVINHLKFIQFKTFLINETNILFDRDASGKEIITYSTAKRYLNQLQFCVENNRALYPYNAVLQAEQGDIKQLEGELAGWCRLRIQSYRVIFRYEMEGSERVARCVFGERRALVYELFAEEIKRLLKD